MTCLRRCFFYDTLLANRRFESTVRATASYNHYLLKKHSTVRAIFLVCFIVGYQSTASGVSQVPWTQEKTLHKNMPNFLLEKQCKSKTNGKSEEKSLVINEKSQNTFQKTIHKSEPHNSHFLLWVIFGFILTRVLLKINNKGE